MAQDQIYQACLQVLYETMHMKSGTAVQVYIMSPGTTPLIAMATAHATRALASNSDTHRRGISLRQYTVTMCLLVQAIHQINNGTS